MPAVAVNPGPEGNAAANTIIVNTSAYDDVTGITNAEAFKGGVPEEDDDSLYARLHEQNLQQGDRGTGNPSDYKRWAESIQGTGTATVIRAKDKSALVTIVLTDGNGDPASEELCEKVYDYIMSPDDDDRRMAPCGAFLSVIPPTTNTLTITGVVELTSGTIESITSEFVTKLKEYFPTAIENKEILYHKVCNILGDIEGVYDISGVTVNGGTANIALADDVMPYVTSSNITLTLAE